MTKIKIQFLALVQRTQLPWNLSRVLFLFIGIAVLYQAILDDMWIGIIFGLYFVATGLFAWGCAGGNCQVPDSTEMSKTNIEIKEII